jgi:hypothetical protein
MRRQKMANRKLQLGILVVLCASGVALGQAESAEAAKIAGDALNGSLNLLEREFVSAADAMPDEKFSFAAKNGRSHLCPAGEARG